MSLEIFQKLAKQIALNRKLEGKRNNNNEDSNTSQENYQTGIVITKHPDDPLDEIKFAKLLVAQQRTKIVEDILTNTCQKKFPIWLLFAGRVHSFLVSSTITFLSLHNVIKQPEDWA